jgi:hypothetical protein
MQIALHANIIRDEKTVFRLIVHQAVREEILSLPAGVQAKLIRQLDKLRNPTVLRARQQTIVIWLLKYAPSG